MQKIFFHKFYDYNYLLVSELSNEQLQSMKILELNTQIMNCRPKLENKLYERKDNFKKI